VDFLIDNGAQAGKDDEAALNAVANALNGWLWVCEYVAALSRKGKHPGILRSIAAPGAEEHNQTVTRDRRELFPCEIPIPSGELSAHYLKRVDKLLQDMAEETTRTQVDQAADKIAQHIKAGRKALVATCEHILMHEMTQDRLTPVQPFNVVWRAKRACQENVKPDDLVVFFGYIGVSTPYEDYLAALRETKAKLVTSFIPDKDKAENNASEAVAHITQHWAVPDAEVPIPFPPERMAPVSGLNQALLFRMLERAVKARLDGEVQAKPSRGQ
jgi:hypothetical protein